MPKLNKQQKKYLKIGIISFLILFGILSIRYALIAKEAYHHTMAGKEQFDLLKTDVKDKNLIEASNKMKSAQESFALAEKEINKLWLPKILPYIGTHIRAGEDLLVVGNKMSSVLNEAFLLGNDILLLLDWRDDITYEEIPKENKKAVLAKIIESEEVLTSINTSVGESVEVLEGIPYHKLHSFLRGKLEPLSSRLPALRNIADNLQPIVEFAPTYLGYEEGKGYLFFLQNYNELRPTGGFIGTYGYVLMQDADFENLYTENVYLLDDPAEPHVFVEPPAPIRKYLDRKEWLFRDSNWSPDFPTAAQKAHWFYDEEIVYHPERKDDDNPVDVVFAITPKVIAKLLGITGEIEVDGLYFNEHNLADELENNVAIARIEGEDRKEVINKLAQKLKARLDELPAYVWLDVAQAWFDSLSEKHILAFTYDEKLKKFLRERNWDGKIIEANSDYAFVVDTNLASLKTDAFVERERVYTVKPSEEDTNKLIARIEITFINNAKFTWKTTRVRSYTRLYVPKGSTLIKHEGLMENDRTTVPGKVDVYDELDKTVFAGFIAIEPGEEGTMAFEYELPKEILEKAHFDNHYSLYFQKQAGTHSPNLILNIDLGKRVGKAFVDGQRVKTKRNSFEWEGEVLSDKEFELELK